MAAAALRRREAGAQMTVVPVGIPVTGAPDYRGVLVILEADGLRGIGEAGVVAARGWSLEEVVRELESGGGESAPAAAALEMAGLDLEARRTGVRVVDLLGGARRDWVECNTLVLEAEPAAVARSVERQRSDGFRAFKLKSSDGSGVVDQARLGAARWAAGPHAALRLDLGGALSEAVAGSRLAGLASFLPEFVEQPLEADAGAPAWGRLAGRLPFPIAADESLAGPDAGAVAAAAGVAAIKLATVGGPRRALEIARTAGSWLLASSFESSVGLAGALHCACAMASEPRACGLATARLLESDLAWGLAVSEGRLRLPEGPGLGVELDPAALERYRLDR